MMPILAVRVDEDVNELLCLGCDICGRIEDSLGLKEVQRAPCRCTEVRDPVLNRVGLFLVVLVVWRQDYGASGPCPGLGLSADTAEFLLSVFNTRDVLQFIADDLAVEAEPQFIAGSRIDSQALGAASAISGGGCDLSVSGVAVENSLQVVSARWDRIQAAWKSCMCPRKGDRCARLPVLDILRKDKPDPPLMQEMARFPDQVRRDKQEESSTDRFAGELPAQFHRYAELGGLGCLGVLTN